ncbi:MAG: DEAD/DEAH box helicase [Cyanobacteria bacterium P01_H01_bin.15]
MTTTFSDLGLSQARLERLQELGFDTPTDIQRQAIPELLKGRDIVGQSQTGTGKTAAYSLPLLDKLDLSQRHVQGVILAPTRELAQQVGDAIADLAGERKLRIATICGGQSFERQIRALQRGAQLVVGTPGRVIDLLERRELRFEQLRWAVLDEADEMLSMGFIDDVRTILRQAPAERQIACFSATMPVAIKQLVKEFLNDPATISIKQTNTTPTRIEQHLYFVPRRWSKIQTLLPILEVEDPTAAIIFVRTKRMAGELTNTLQASGLSADEYHGNLSQSQRERLVQRFRDGKVRLLVATDIAARGLDVEHLSHSINFDMPESAETYIHRIGRTGRAGREGTAISIVDYRERRLLRNIEHHLGKRLTNRSVPTRAEVEAKHLSKFRTRVQDALAGERMASFLPMVHDLSADYDPMAIAAAALQMVYDQDCPNWLSTDWDAPQTSEKPIIRKNRSGGRHNSRRPYASSSR